MIKLIQISIFLLFASIAIRAQDLNVSLQIQNAHCSLGSASIIINSAAIPYHILWSNGTTSDEIKDLSAGDYSVTVIDDHNHDTTIYFSVNEELCEPNAGVCFTPNNDGYNDTWNISNLKHFPEFDLYVYNRWGQLVHHQTENYIPWDGTNLGMQVADGAYYYILYLSKSDKNKFIKGDVNILR